MSQPFPFCSDPAVFTEDSHGSSPRDWPASSLANAEGEFAVKEQLEKLVLQMYRSGILYSESVREIQRVFMLTVLREQRASQVRAAQTLEMHRNTFRRIFGISNSTAGCYVLP